MFDGIFEAIENWMRDLLTGMVTSNLTTMFTDVNEKTGEIASQVGQTPQGWNSSIFTPDTEPVKLGDYSDCGHDYHICSLL